MIKGLVVLKYLSISDFLLLNTWQYCFNNVRPLISLLLCINIILTSFSKKKKNHLNNCEFCCIFVIFFRLLLWISLMLSPYLHLVWPSWVLILHSCFGWLCFTMQIKCSTKIIQLIVLLAILGKWLLLPC